MRVTINNINAKTRELGYEIARGEGYHYFYPVGKYPNLWASSVYVYHLGSYSVDGWVEELKELIKQSNIELDSFHEHYHRAQQGLDPVPPDTGPIVLSRKLVKGE